VLLNEDFHMIYKCCYGAGATAAAASDADAIIAGACCCCCACCGSSSGKKKSKIDFDSLFDSTKPQSQGDGAWHTGVSAMDVMDGGEAEPAAAAAAAADGERTQGPTGFLACCVCAGSCYRWMQLQLFAAQLAELLLLSD
jgi:hypothetical protein